MSVMLCNRHLIFGIRIIQPVVKHRVLPIQSFSHQLLMMVSVIYRLQIDKIIKQSIELA